MLVKQISVFIENKKGRAANLTKTLAENGIDLVSLSIADTTNFGILRCIVDDSNKALKVLKESGYTAGANDVLAVEVEDKPGGLAKVLAILDEAGISIEYLYSFVRIPSKSALILFRVEEIDKATKVLEKKGIRLLLEKDVFGLKK